MIYREHYEKYTPHGILVSPGLLEHDFCLSTNNLAILTKMQDVKKGLQYGTEDQNSHFKGK